MNKFIFVLFLVFFCAVIAPAEAEEHEGLQHYLSLLNDALSGRGAKAVSLHCGYLNENEEINRKAPHISISVHFDIDCPANQDCRPFFQHGRTPYVDIHANYPQDGYTDHMEDISLGFTTAGSSYQRRVKIVLWSEKSNGIGNIKFLEYKLAQNAAPFTLASPFIPTPSNVYLMAKNGPGRSVDRPNQGSEDNKCYFTIRDPR